MNPNDFFKTFNSLKREIKGLEVRSEEIESCSVAVLACTQRIEEFLWDFLQQIQELQEVSQARSLLLKDNLTSRRPQKARELFLVDQVLYLKQWVRTMETSFIVHGAPCLLQISSRDMLLFARLIREADLIGKGDLMQLFLFIQQHFRTMQQRELSLESLRKKYSMIDRNQLLRMNDLLLKLLRINGDYLDKQKGNRRN